MAPMHRLMQRMRAQAEQAAQEAVRGQEETGACRGVAGHDGEAGKAHNPYGGGFGFWGGRQRTLFPAPLLQTPFAFQNRNES